MGTEHTVSSAGKEGTNFNVIGGPTFKDFHCKAKRNRQVYCSPFHPVGTNRRDLLVEAQQQQRVRRCHPLR